MMVREMKGKMEGGMKENEEEEVATMNVEAVEEG